MWVGVGACGWVWVGVGGCEWVAGWVWVGVGGCGWVWVGVGGCGWVWVCAAGMILVVEVLIGFDIRNPVRSAKADPPPQTSPSARRGPAGSDSRAPASGCCPTWCSRGSRKTGWVLSQFQALQGRISMLAPLLHRFTAILKPTLLITLLAQRRQRHSVSRHRQVGRHRIFIQVQALVLDLGRRQRLP